MKLSKLFASMLKLSACTFGGGYVILSMMRREFVEKEQALTAAELCDLTAIAQSAPGPLTVNAAFLVGNRLEGWRGALTAVAGAVLPPLVILSLASLGYEALAALAPVQAMLRFLRCAVAAIVLDVSWGLAKEQGRDLFAIILAGGGLAALIAGLNPALLILIGGLVGACRGLLPRLRERKV